MDHSPVRRSFLFAAVTGTLMATCDLPRAATLKSTQEQLAQLETSANGRLGVAAFDTAGGRHVLHRADERFAVCSTSKLMVSAAILSRSMGDAALLSRNVSYRKGDLVAYSPITEKHVDSGMTVAQLCAAALQYSDNSASNLLMKILGGPAAVTAYARSIGDTLFRLDRWEPELNTAIPGDQRDTSTPAAMAASVQKLVLGDALAAAQREQLKTWVLANTTGDARIRAGVPAGWQVGDKTGTGDYGTTNDIGVLWPPSRAPMVVAIYFTQHSKDAQARNDVIASAARIVADALG